MKSSEAKRQHRLSRHKRVRAKIQGSLGRPRVAVFKSNKHVFVQFIDDTTGKTILSSKIVSATKTKIKGTKTDKAGSVGEMLAEKAKELGISEAVFDRGGFKFHGRVKAVAEGLKKGGIKI
jgi:large subunit ribosomal protein L18